jgi:hypothetical protein
MCDKVLKVNLQQLGDIATTNDEDMPHVGNTAEPMSRTEANTKPASMRPDRQPGKRRPSTEIPYPMVSIQVCDVMIDWMLTV